MTYEAISRIAQQGGTLYFVLMFAAAIGYAFWPKNNEKFAKAARAALDTDDQP
ncbi:MAG TPA: cbb3-type cytochrome c oxidase subunit 3 [Caulobacteraceae bacterium]|jgi:cytochrome c oxidase cbb3-type subunit 4|nr:cbb3-type cytochrome c oxidase subunit 3 [Caulobacteraceae bacterium]